MGKFINRTNELNMLKKQYEQPEAAFVVIYGRRRIGKSGLSKYLSTLCDLDILERQVPITEENPEKSNNHVSFVYEDICREKVWEMNGNPMMFNRVGRWWNKDTEIDIVAYDSMRNDILFGECKYSQNPKGLEVLSALKQKAHEVIWNKDRRKEYFVIFSKSGFTKELEERAKESDNIFLEQ